VPADLQQSLDESVDVELVALKVFHRNRVVIGALVIEFLN
jgi:hypothetical protein